MQTAAEYDVLILGGGCAGLSLAMRLAESGYGGQVAVIEPRREYRDDRSWCFWAPEAHPMAELVSSRWDRWLVSQRNGQPVDCSAPGYSYQYVNSLDFYQRALTSIRACPNTRLLLGESAHRTYRLNDHLVVDTARSSLRTRWLIDTRPPATNHLAQAILYQCFLGQVVTLTDDTPGVFDVDMVELMTDMHSDRLGLEFSYVLPFGPRRALVEVTRFSKEPVEPGQMREALEDLLQRRGWRVAAVEREESAVLPMGLPALAPEPLPGYVRAGTGGGALRAASGYGFQRIQRWATRCCRSLVSGGPPLPQTADPVGRAWMDQHFLRVLRDQPEQAPRVFERMFNRVPGPVLLRFLSDRAGWLDSLRVVGSLPTRPFLAKLIRTPTRPSAGVA